MLPGLQVPNSEFHENVFYDKNGVRNELPGEQVTKKLEAIAGNRERRYIPFDQEFRPLMTNAACSRSLFAGYFSRCGNPGYLGRPDR